MSGILKIQLPMNAKQILKLLPGEYLDKLSSKLDSDYKVKKLTSKTIFMVILYSLFSEKMCTLRKMKQNFDKKTFQKKILGKQSITTIHHTSFHYRMQNINYRYFENIFLHLFRVVSKKIQKSTFFKFEILRVDSTLINLSSKLANIGFNQTSNDPKKKIKLTISYSDLPEQVKFYESVEGKSEEVALKESILSKEIPKNQILIFDRGLSHRETYDAITSKGHYFISRLNENYRFKEDEEDKEEVKGESKKEEPIDTETLLITKERKGKLYRSDNKETETSYRIIHGKQKTKIWDRRQNTSLRNRMKSKKNSGKSKEEVRKEMENEEIIFVTNIPSKKLSSEEVSLIYKRRWDIETFFKGLKQELHMSHLVNNSVNGIKVMIYIVLIFMLLMLLYKQSNNLKGYKYVKSKLVDDLEEEFYRYIVIISGGSLSKWENSTGEFW